MAGARFVELFEVTAGAVLWKGADRGKSVDLAAGRRFVIFGRFVVLRLRKLDGFAGQRGHLVGGTDATFGGVVGEGRGRSRVDHRNGSLIGER